jgi:hypothetical protein
MELTEIGWYLVKVCCFEGDFRERSKNWAFFVEICVLVKNFEEICVFWEISVV